MEQERLQAYCKIIGTRERDYGGIPLTQGISREMTVFSGGAGLPYTEDVIRAARDVFQLYGDKVAYRSGVFSSVMRSVAGQAFVCYGISQKQAMGRDAQFTQLFIAPREALLNGDSFRSEVLNCELIEEEAIHRDQRPSPSEIFRTKERTRVEVNTLEQGRLYTLMRTASLLCTGKKVLLVERDEAYRKDYFRPLLRELFELIPAGHRYQIDVTTGRCEDDIERLSAAQLVVTDRPFANAAGRYILWTDAEKEISPTSGEARWARLTNAERDEFSGFVGGSNITLQTEYNRLMDCMDDEKSFWWQLSEYNGKFRTLEELLRRHESTPILGMPRINLQFCRRMPELLEEDGDFEDYYFQLGQDRNLTDEQKRWCFGYIERGRLRKFGLDDGAFERIKENYMNFENVLKEMQAMNAKFDGITALQGEALNRLEKAISDETAVSQQRNELVQRQATEQNKRIEALIQEQLGKTAEMQKSVSELTALLARARQETESQSAAIEQIRQASQEKSNIPKQFAAMKNELEGIKRGISGTLQDGLRRLEKAQKAQPDSSQEVLRALTKVESLVRAIPGNGGGGNPATGRRNGKISGPVWIWIAIGAVMLVLVGAVVFLLLR